MHYYVCINHDDDDKDIQILRAINNYLHLETNTLATQLYYNLTLDL